MLSCRVKEDLLMGESDGKDCVRMGARGALVMQIAMSTKGAEKK